MEALLGSLFGGVFRMAPEILKWLDRKDERKHEITMFDLQLKADEQKANAQIQQATIQADSAIAAGELQALIAATQAQAQQTGIKWVDALNALVRPILAFQWLIFLWPGVILAGFFAAISHGTDPITALNAAFGPEEQAMASSIAAFWLVDRSLRKGFNK